MRVRNFAVSLTAAAVTGAFGPAFAQTVNVDPKGAASNQSSSTNVNPNVGVGANVGIGNSDVNAGVNDKETGLNRADQAAGEHGKQGRDNAREKQGERGQRGGSD